MKRPLVVAGLLLAIPVVLLALFLVAIEVFGWNWARRPIANRISAATGREVQIAGDLDVDLGWRPRVTAERVAFGNADWSAAPNMFSAERLAFRFRLLPLLIGRMRIDELRLAGADLRFEKSSQGIGNWELEPRSAGGGGASGERSDFHLPSAILVESSGLHYIDHGTARVFDFQLARLAAEGAEAAVYTVEADGTYRELPLTARGVLGALELWTRNEPYPVRVSARVGPTRARLHGELREPRALQGLNARLELRGEDLHELWTLLGLPLAHSPAYQVAGRLTREGDVWGLHKFRGALGKSDMRGDLAVELRPQRRPLLRAAVRSRVLDLDDVEGFWGKEVREENGSKPAAKRPILSDEPFSFAKLRAMDADLDFRAQQIHGRSLLENVVLDLDLEGGRARLHPLQLGFAGGRLVSNATIDARRDTAALDGDLVLSSIDLERLLRDLELQHKGKGTIGGRADLRTHGNSLRQMAAHLDGELGALMQDGEVGETLLELVAIDFGEAIVAHVYGNKPAPVECAVGTFDIEDGRFEARTLLFDSHDVRLTGEGWIDLAREEMDLRIHQHPKDFSIGTLRSPIDIQGSLAERKATVRKSGLFRRAGAAAALGALLHPVAALIPLVELGRGEKPGACAAAISDLERIARADSTPAPPARRASGSKGK